MLLRCQLSGTAAEIKWLSDGSPDALNPEQGGKKQKKKGLAR